MKNRFMYAVLLLTGVSQGALAQEFSGTQSSVGPHPYEVLPAMVVSDPVTVPPVPTLPEQPAVPQEIPLDQTHLDDEDMVLEVKEAVKPEESVNPSVPEPTIQNELKEGEHGEKSMINIGLDENKRKEVVNALNVLLSDEYLLYTKTFKYHWNVKGKHFAAMHEFFQKQYEALQGFSDGVAERIRMLGFIAPATFAEFTQFATLREQPGHNPENDLAMIADLLNNHEQIIRNMRGYIDLTTKLDDMGTNNFLADLIEKHEKMAWMLRAHLER